MQIPIKSIALRSLLTIIVAWQVYQARAHHSSLSVVPHEAPAASSEMVRLWLRREAALQLQRRAHAGCKAGNVGNDHSSLDGLPQLHAGENVAFPRG